MKVLMTLDGVGGVFTYASELIAGLTAADAALEVVAVSFGRPLSAHQHAVLAAAGATEIHDSGLALEWMEEPWGDLARAGELLGELSTAHAPDVIHANAFFPGALALDAPVLVVAHSCVLSWWRAVHGTSAPPAWDRYRRTVAAGLAGAAAIVAPTRAMAAALCAEHAVSEDLTVGVIPNASSVPLHDPDAPRQAVALAAGRMWDAAKNLGVLERAAARMRHPLLIAGEFGAGSEAGTGSEAGAPGTPGTAARPGGPVRLGPLSPEALARRREAAAVFVAPARYEPFGLAILEAARAGDALVLADIASLRELWDGAASFVAADDADAIAAELDGLLADPQRRRALAHAAQQRALTYSAEAMVEAHLGLYRRLAASRERTLT